jgi:hypothetical protein
MIDRLQQAIGLIENLPPEIQEQAARQLEAMAQPYQVPSKTRLAGIWHDLPDADTMIDEIDRLRHESVPTPPLEEER